MPSAARPPRVAVVGPSEADPPLVDAAREIGRHLATGGAVVLTGGLGGVMAGAARGAADAGGTCIGLLPGADDEAGDPALSVALPTGLGEGRNLLLVTAAHAVIAVGSSWGTLAEVALARMLSRPVVGLRLDADDRLGPLVEELVEHPADAARWALARVGGG